MTRDRGMQFHIGSPDSDIDEPADFGSPPRRPSPSAPPPSANPLHSTPDSNLAPDGTATDNAANYNDVNSHSPSAALTLSSSPPALETHPSPAPTAPVDNRGDTDSDEDSTWVSRNRKRKQERQPSTRIPSASPADVTSGAEASSPPQSTGPAADAVYVEEDETVRSKRQSSRFLEVPSWTMGHHLTDPEEQEQTSDLANADVTPEVQGLTRLSSEEEEREGQKISIASEASAKSSSSEEFPNKASSRRRTSRQRSTSDTPGSGEERSSPKPSTPTAGPKFFLDVSSERTSSGNDRPPQKKLSWSLPLTDDEATPSLAPDGGEFADHCPRSPRHSTGKVEDDVTDDDLSIGQAPEVTMSDEEFQELYLGNIPAHKRGKSLFLPSAANNRGPSPDSDSCYGSFLSPTASPRKPRRESEGGKRISFEFANPGFVPDESGDLQKANGFGTHLDPAQLERKASRDSTDTLDSHRGSTGSDVSFSRTVAAHVRRDSIALFSDKLHSSPLRRLSLYKLAADLEQLRQEHNQMSKKEILAKYRVHIFVVAIFIISVLFISLGWFYRDKTEQEDSARQKIFLDPRKRILTLSDGHDEVSVLLGQDIPQWQLPMHCQLVEEDNPNSKECLWKNNAVVRVNFFQERVDGGTDTVGCYNVSWETLRSSVVPYDCFNLGTAEWYGPSNQSDGTWPVQGNFSYVPTPYRMGNNGVFSNVFQPYWLSSTGVGLLLNADEPITLQWNTSRPGYLCVVSNYTGPLYGQTYQSRLPFLNYTICNGQDINQTHRVMKTLVRGATPVDLIPREVIMNPIWSAKELAGTDRYNETHIQDFVTKLKTNGMNCSLLVMDGDWQDKHGDLTFDPARFANLANLTELLQTACSLSLEVTPYFDYRSVENFHRGVVENFFVRDDGGRVPGLTRYRPDKAGAMVDVTRPEARTWFGNAMKPVLDFVKPRSLRLAYGQDGWLPYRPTFSDPNLSLQGFKQLVGDSLFDPKRVLIQDHAVLSKRSPGLVAVMTDVVRKDNRLCLDNAIQKALTLGLLGYPYVLADGLAEHPDRLSSDLFIRWMQMAAFFPAFKFSWAPWSQSEDALNQAKNLSLLHSTLVMSNILSEKVTRDVGAGLPILRPAWWLDPANQTVHAMGLNDEFLVGDELLVAPILCEGVTVRDIYVPPGVWGDRLKNNILVQGPKILYNYRIELNEVAYFVRMKVYNGKER